MRQIVVVFRKIQSSLCYRPPASAPLRTMDTSNLIVSYKDNVQIITLNRPSLKNAMDLEMYIQLTGILKSAANNDDILVTVITGNGDFFSSGNDLKSAMGRLDTMLQNAHDIILKFVDAFIEYPKILVAVVNGPAIGIAATTLALYDLVFAAENAFFYTPFTKLGLVAEGCSSYTFPKLLGKRKATEMLIFNYKMSSAEALQLGFVNYVFKPDEVQSQVWDRIYEVAKLPKNVMLISKKLMTTYNKEDLKQANIRETEELANVWQSEEFFNSVMAFVNKKKSKSFSKL